MTAKEQKIKEVFEKEFDGKGYDRDDVLFFGAKWQLNQLIELIKEYPNNLIFGDKFDLAVKPITENAINQFKLR